MGQLNVNGTIDTTGNVLTPNRPAFRVKVTSHGGGETFGSDSGQTYTVAYGDVLPLFKSSERTVEQNVGNCISFHSYPTSTGTGEYLKFTAPVTGTYVFGFSVEMQIKSGDWTSLGFRKNTITPTNDFIEYSLKITFDSKSWIDSLISHITTLVLGDKFKSFITGIRISILCFKDTLCV